MCINLGDAIRQFISLFHLLLLYDHFLIINIPFETIFKKPYYTYTIIYLAIPLFVVDVNFYVYKDLNENLAI